MTEDVRCCGTGTCIINDEGVCWCGQQWDGEKMCFPKPAAPARPNEQPGSDAALQADDDPAQ